MNEALISEYIDSRHLLGYARPYSEEESYLLEVTQQLFEKMNGGEKREAKFREMFYRIPAPWEVYLKLSRQSRGAT